MSRLVYNGVDLSEVRSLTFSYDPVFDPAGVDVLYTRVTLQVMSVINANWWATGKPAGPPGTPGGNMTIPGLASGRGGDRMPLSVAKLRHLLSQPRRPLEFSIGSDVIIDAPELDGFGDRMESDCEDGPKTKNVRVMQFYGEKTAVASLTIEVCLNDCDNEILSNRWTMRHAVSDSGYLTRTTTGTAVFRSDYLAIGDTSADSFRKYLLVPVDSPLQRAAIDVSLSEDGSTVTYTTVDVETTVGLGILGNVYRIEGTCTAGGENMMGGNWFDFAARAQGIFAAGATGNFSGLIPRSHASIMVRVFGESDANKAALYNVALLILEDRFAGALSGGRARYDNLYLTQGIGSHDEPFVELRANLFIGGFSMQLLFNPIVFSIGVMNLDTDMTRSGINIRRGGLNHKIDGTDVRGVGWHEVLFHQKFSEPCALPELPSKRDDAFRGGKEAGAYV